MGDYSISTSKIRKVFEKRGSGLLSLRREKEQIIALDDIDLNVKNGELFGLLGPNGAGKTTLGKILSTIIVPIAVRPLSMDMISINDLRMLDNQLELFQAVRGRYTGN